ncbi:hypothetical protein KP509_22G011300 [Ceratopteris richardii]|uniref:Uncharacterized protein n=1 Tax=Ceratopteris richardii TaxID=49495 RepID=A0A8T2S3L9_CERRI|nr:hypothetical protein KP509_22G011300 [Ceratopteris richardii]KAH7306429.1 hypothetical protein KP509_22G011300 [Ceratopteris richardii]KAH7306430.1 hypothetical protein KP509_22G011300 [Ceratopteris richardii]
MNPLTQVKNTQKITAREAALGISESGSWHAKYKDSAYVYAGNFSFDLTEGDLLAIFAQYGEIVDINLVRDKGTGKSRGFAFLAYEDQRSTVLAVDNLNGANIVGRTIKVDHVAKYRKKTEEDEEEEQRKREERGVCRAFQRGECNRGSSCKFSHDEKRSANTGWGPKEDSSRWTHDRYDEGSWKRSKGRDEDDRRKESQSMVRDKQGNRGDERLQDRERIENRLSDFHSERETTASRKRHYESQSYIDKDRRQRDKDNRSDRDESRSYSDRDYHRRQKDDRSDHDGNQRYIDKDHLHRDSDGRSDRDARRNHIDRDHHHRDKDDRSAHDGSRTERATRDIGRRSRD